MSVLMELVVIMSLQWLSTKVIYLLTLCYWYKLVQVHAHGSICISLFMGWWGIHVYFVILLVKYGLVKLSSASASEVCPRSTSLAGRICHLQDELNWNKIRIFSVQCDTVISQVKHWRRCSEVISDCRTDRCPASILQTALVSRDLWRHNRCPSVCWLQRHSSWLDWIIWRPVAHCCHIKQPVPDLHL